MATSLPILLFHTLDDDRSDISFSPRLFRDSVARLSESGYRAVDLLEAVDCLRRGSPFDDRTLVLTFDDGYETVYDEAFPVLQQYGMCATVFLTVGERGAAESTGRLPSLEGRSMLTWHQIREMHQRGVSFGAHTLTHAALTRLPSDRIEAEMRGSKAIIEDLLGVPVASFAYPYGRYHPRSREIAEQHFACACTDTLGLVASSSDPFALERVDAHYLWNGALVNLVSTPTFLWYVQVRSLARGIRRGFQQRWGGR